MDLVDEMLVRIGDYTADVEHYAVLRQRLRREFGGLHTNDALWALEAVIDAHLHHVNNRIWDSLGFHEGDLSREQAAMAVTRELFDAGRRIHGNNLVACCLLHASVLRQAGVCGGMFDDFAQQVRSTAAMM